ncbi:ornithine cyclodeaminase family protein [Methanoplanus sp. FWC-SCC4]|uniref:Alanine dehydrogenase n=1 Tax=Methanochimaera problematica TaxID=2609417 RepID=A0AA97FAE0_9EURY|nr:ornithine cyclodeaminase family protein [Methanoplanus sp. FWC-SCC4]WOF15267.1 ornithine cyclodeaminase family protein [Methanoplanus sp. FWC-SCC4]
MKYYPNPESGIDLKELNATIEEAFAEHGRGNVQMPSKVYVDFKKGDFRTMPAYIPSLDIAGVKIVNVHPENPKIGLPTVMALTTILDVETGIPMAILNATKLTDLRTAAAGAVASKYLSFKKSVTLGLIGSGRQAQTQVEAIAEEKNIENIKVWSRNESHAEDFCRMFSRFDCQTASMEKACDCDILITTTPSRTPVVKSEWVQEGTHINAIGADAPGKEELDPELLKRSTVIIDDYEQAIHSGEINVPIEKGLYSRDMIAGTLGEYVLGTKRRECPEEITIFDSTGLGIQDLAIAKIAMEKDNFIELVFP